MELAEKLYQNENKELQEIWKNHPFVYFNPKLIYLGFQIIREAVENQDYEFFTNRIRNNFLPELGNREVDEAFIQAANRGINSLNYLCNENLGETAAPFLMEELTNPNLFDLTRTARENWIKSRNGRHSIDISRFFPAYNSVRAYGLGNLVLMIDTSPEVLNSVRHNNLALNWFTHHFRFRSPEKTDIEGLPFSWKTDAEVRVYGSESKAIKSRLKILTEDGSLKYGSILMKMTLKGSYTDEIMDFSGVEFIVKDQDDRDKLVNYFRKMRGSATLEKFKSPGKRGAQNRSKHSNSDFDCTKFIIRPPVSVSSIEPFKQPYERIPVEVQILTLDAHRQRTENPDVAHEAYKRRQFMEAFPLWYPREVYEHKLMQVS